MNRKLETRESRQSLPAWFLFVLASYFVACYAVALHWYDLGIFSRNDLLFSADPNTNLKSLANGWGWGRNALSHPLLEYFAALPRLGAEVFAFTFKIDDKLLVRDYLAMLYPPFFGALSGAILFRLCTLSGYNKHQSAQVSLTYLLSFSCLIFSITPEAYALAGFFLIALLYYYRVCEQRGCGSHRVWWALGIMHAGITITNVLVYCLAYWLFLRRVVKYSPTRSICLATLSVAAAISVGFAGLRLGVYLVDGTIGPEGGINWISAFSSFSISELGGRWGGLLQSFLNTFAPLNWSTGDNGLTFSKNLQTASSALWTGAFFLPVLALAIPRLRQMYSTDLLTLLSGIMVFNFALHSVFGDELFLYSQHWLAALTLLLAPGLAGAPWMQIAIGALASVAAACNVYFVLHTVPAQLGSFL
jgi:hypothetical protein